MSQNKNRPIKKVRLYEGLFLSMIIGSLWLTTSLATNEETSRRQADTGQGGTTAIQLPSVTNHTSPYDRVASLQKTYLTDALETAATALAQSGGQSGLYLSDLLGKGGQASSQQTMEAGSFWLLWLVADVLERVEGGVLSLDDFIPYLRSYQQDGSAHLGAGQLGMSFSLDQYLTWIIQDQDLEAANLLLDYIGGTQVVNQRLVTYGLYDSHLEGQEGTTTLADLGHFFQGLMQGSILARQSAYLWERLALTTDRDLLGLGQDYAGLLWKADQADQGVAGQALVYEGPNGPGLILALVNQAPNLDLGQAMKKIHPAILDMYHKYWQNLTNIGTDLLKDRQVLANDTLSKSLWQWGEDPDQVVFLPQVKAWERMDWLQTKNQLVTQGLRGAYQLGDNQVLWVKGQTIYLWNKITKTTEAIYYLTSLQRTSEEWTGRMVYWNEAGSMLDLQEVAFRQEGTNLTMGMAGSGLTYHLTRMEIGQDQASLPWNLVYSPAIADWSQEILVDQQGGIGLTSQAIAQGWTLNQAKAPVNLLSYWDQAAYYWPIISQLQEGYSTFDQEQDHILPYELTNGTAKLSWAYQDLEGDGSLELLLALDSQVRRIYTLVSSRQGLEVVALGPWAYYQWLGQGIVSWQASLASVPDQRAVLSLWQGRPGLLMEWTWDPQAQTYILETSDKRMSPDRANQEVERWKLGPRDWNSLLWYDEG